MKSIQNNQFDVGSVIYFISSKTEKVIPALVAEKIVRTSKSSSKVTYILEIRTTNATKTAEVDPQITDLFATPEAIREFMISRTTDAIDNLIKVAVASASHLKASATPAAMEAAVASEEPVEVVLEDGQIAKLRM